MPRYIEELGKYEMTDLDIICAGKCKSEFPVKEFVDVCPDCGSDRITFVQKYRWEKHYCWRDGIEQHEGLSLLSDVKNKPKYFSFNPISIPIKLVKKLIKFILK